MRTNRNREAGRKKGYLQDLRFELGFNEWIEFELLYHY